MNNIPSCGLCEKSFRTREECDRHFEGDEHRKNMNNPMLITSKVMQSQMAIIAKFNNKENNSVPSVSSVAKKKN